MGQMCRLYWTAASETHQRKSNIFIIQQNKRNVKDRSFSRKIESERSFFVSESHRIDAQLKTVIDRTLARWTKVRNKEFYYIMKCADDNRAAMETTLACFRGYADCVSGAVEKGIIYGTGVYEKGEVSGKNVIRSFVAGS